jgi:hypothetical protein
MGYEFDEIKERLREDTGPVRQVYIELAAQKVGVGKTLYPPSGDIQLIQQAELRGRARDRSPGT